MASIAGVEKLSSGSCRAVTEEAEDADLPVQRRLVGQSELMLVERERVDLLVGKHVVLEGRGGEEKEKEGGIEIQNPLALC